MTSEQKTTTAKAKTKAAKEAELAAKEAQLHAKEKAAAVEAETAQEEAKTKVSDAVAPETPNVQPEANQAQSEGEDISQKLPKAENVNDESSTPGNVVQDDSASVKEVELEAKEAALKAQEDALKAKEDAYDAAMTLRSQNLSLHVKDRDELNQESQPVKDNLLPLQLKVINHGEACLCFVTKNVIPANGEVVITYPSNKKRDIAIKNFAQINALSGFMRLEVEG